MEIKTKLNINDEFLIIELGQIKKYCVENIFTTTELNGFYVPQTEIIYEYSERGEMREVNEKNVFATKEELKQYIDNKEF